MPRPVILGVVGDSAAGKTTITRGLVARARRGATSPTSAPTTTTATTAGNERELGITPLHPDCNYVDIIAQHLVHLRRGDAILKPVYRHQDGTFGPPVYVQSGALHGHRGAARLLPAGDARHLRRARVPEPARGTAPPVEGAARLLAPRVHDRPGARRARPARARLRGVHPAAATLRRHARVVPAGRGAGATTRRTSTPS